MHSVRTFGVRLSLEDRGRMAALSSHYGVTGSALVRLMLRRFERELPMVADPERAGAPEPETESEIVLERRTVVPLDE